MALKIAKMVISRGPDVRFKPRDTTAIPLIYKRENMKNGISIDKWVKPYAKQPMLKTNAIMHQLCEHQLIHPSHTLSRLGPQMLC